MSIFSSDIVKSAISASISDTAVDVFVYDTSKDSDGGAWRKRTQNTSWYNETLGTATRGSRKEFPAVAVIVVEDNKVTIYDGDDPDLPLWITFPTTTAKGVTALNGELCLCSYASASAYHGLLRINFVADQAINHRESNSATVQGYFIYTLSSTDLAKIDDGPSSWTGYTSEVPNIVNGNCNDITMTVLPNAPVDSATGLPVPTIAVATAGGLSVIKDDGSVFDIVYTNNENTVSVAFNSSGNLHFVQHDNDVQFVNVPVPTQDYANGTASALINSIGGSAYHTANSISGNAQSAILGDVVNDTLPNATSGPSGLTFISNETPTGYLQGAVAYATTSYNTGWMHGDIKGAFLSDTDTTNVTGSEKIPNPGNGNFTATTDWVAQTAGGSLSISGANLKVTCNGNYHGCQVNTSNLPTLVEGKQYIMTVDVAAVSAGSIRFGVVSGMTYSGSIGGDGIHHTVFTAGASVTQIFIDTGNYGSSMYFELNSVNLREAELDRSVNGGVGNNNKGLAVFGTVTKSAVATGAELVDYSGFTSGNYLQQPYNSDLDFGTGDLSATFWFNGNNAGNTSLWERGAASGQNFGVLTVSGQLYLTGFGANQPIGSPHANAGDASWGHVVLLRENGVWKAYLNGETTSWAYTNAANLTNTSAVLNIGGNVAQTSFANAKKITLFRISASVPSAEQVKKMYNDEKHLFHENSKATLYGSSDAVTALAFDEVTDQLHVGTSSGRSDFQGLCRINNTTTAVTTAISAHDEFIIEQ